MARQIKHFEIVAGLREEAARYSARCPVRYANVVADIVAVADCREAEFKALGLWKKACYGIRCECRKD